MSAYIASAPGKLVMAGEYAVLEGAPALVLALDRRARARVEPTAAAGVVVDAPDLGIRQARARWQHGAWQWQDGAGQTGKLKLVMSVLSHFDDAFCAGAGLHLELDTAAFFAPEGQGKLGLGSSAALTTALTAACCAALGRPVPELGVMLRAHRRMQGGRGSGLDIAASRVGGTLVYRLVGDQPQWRPLRLPGALHWRVVWSGRPASTGDALSTLARWRAGHADTFDRHMRDLSELAGKTVAAVETDDAGVTLDALACYAAALAAFGVASGIDIVCDEHRRIAALAAARGLVYKTSGAGGGDIGMAFGRDDAALDEFSRHVAAAGFRVLDAGLDPHGLDLRDDATQDRRQAWTTSA